MKSVWELIAEKLKREARNFRKHKVGSKYVRHQGAQEKARRVRQMARGIIK